MAERIFNPDEPELMDREGEFSPEWEKDLANLRGLNRHFGGHAIIRQFFETLNLAAGDELSVLDLCTGSADLPAYLVEIARESGIKIRVDAIDLHPATLQGAHTHLEDRYPEITVHQADVLLDKLPSQKYDVVLCSLALHHFTEDDAVKLLARMREHATRAVLLADLERSALCTTAVWLVTTFIYRDPMTVIDGRQSAAAAFSKGELQNIATRAGWENPRHARHPIGRQSITLYLDKSTGPAA